MVRKERIQYYDYIIIIFEVVDVYIFVDLVKRGVLTLVGEIWRCRSDHIFLSSLLLLGVTHTANKNSEPAEHINCLLICGYIIRRCNDE